MESFKLAIFFKYSAEMKPEYQSLLLYTEIRWLSRGNVLARLFELRYEVSNFLLNQGMPELHQLLEYNTGWPNLNTWLTYSSTSMNSIKMQGRHENLLICSDKLNGFKPEVKPSLYHHQK